MHDLTVLFLFLCVPLLLVSPVSGDCSEQCHIHESFVEPVVAQFMLPWLSANRKVSYDDLGRAINQTDAISVILHEGRLYVNTPSTTFSGEACSFSHFTFPPMLTNVLHRLKPLDDLLSVADAFDSLSSEIVISMHDSGRNYDMQTVPYFSEARFREKNFDICYPGYYVRTSCARQRPDMAVPAAPACPCGPTFRSEHMHVRATREPPHLCLTPSFPRMNALSSHGNPGRRHFSPAIRCFLACEEGC